MSERQVVSVESQSIPLCSNYDPDLGYDFSLAQLQ